MTLRIVVLYALFAAIATVVNIGTQALVFSAATAVPPLAGLALGASIIAGTGMGLACKYVLDKKWIFQYKPVDSRDEARAFALYTVMGIATTALYLGCELMFHWIFKSDAMRYLGAAAGLCIGYSVKYVLDRRYSFRSANS